MLLAALITLAHLFLAGVLAFVADEINPDYTFTVFSMYFITTTMLGISNYYSLLAGIVHDRENTLSLIDEKYQREEQ